ncbi:hypothetical protein [uncultured Tenacibaculum sp.]|uniref:hypothetical protein n=1 Tax=uncultured Tenacibaculum sp. TaxID=174713 RepID=UPI00261A2D76|nr:hypothetical protein [uncultured Tenacibaculum sp.]
MKTQKKLRKRIEEYDLMLTQNFDDEIYATLLKEKNEIELELKKNLENENKRNRK